MVKAKSTTKQEAEKLLINTLKVFYKILDLIKWLTFFGLAAMVIGSVYSLYLYYNIDYKIYVSGFVSIVLICNYFLAKYLLVDMLERSIQKIFHPENFDDTDD